MRILVTGAGGFAGRHLVDALARHYGARASILGMEFRASPHERTRAAQIESVAADLRDTAATLDVVRRFVPHVTVNLAAISSVPDALADAAAAYELNTAAASTLGRAVAANAPGSLFVQASTADIYGREFLKGEAVAESSPVSPQNPYARSKLAAEFALQDIASGACRVVALRLSNHVGPGQDERFAAASFAAQIARIEAGRASAVLKTGDLTAERDFVDVGDAMRAYIALIEADRPKSGFALYNVASGRSRSIRSVLDGFLRLTSAQIDVVQDPARLRPSDIPLARISAAAFQAATGWTPQRAFDDTLQTVLADWRGRVAAEAVGTVA